MCTHKELTELLVQFPNTQWLESKPKLGNSVPGHLYMVGFRSPESLLLLEIYIFKKLDLGGGTSTKSRNSNVGR